jgi:hypothetical protein
MRHLIDRISAAAGTQPLTESVKSYNDFVQDAAGDFLDTVRPLIGKVLGRKPGAVSTWRKDNAVGMRYTGQNAEGKGMDWWCQLLRESMFTVAIDVRWSDEETTHDYTFKEAVHDLVPQVLVDEFSKAFNGTA